MRPAAAALPSQVDGRATFAGMTGFKLIASNAGDSDDLLAGWKSGAPGPRAEWRSHLAQVS